MSAGQLASLATAAICLLAATLPQASLAQVSMSMDEQDTCWGALDLLRGCSAGMVYHDLQQHCCIPFRALEGINCFCGEDIAGAAINTLVPGVIDGLEACGVASPFSRIYTRQDACATALPAVALPALVDEGDEWMALEATSALDSGAIRMAPGVPAIELPTGSAAYYDMSDDAVDRLWDLFMEGSDDIAKLPEEEGMSIDVALDGGREMFTVSSESAMDIALYDGVLSISDNTDVLLFDGVSQVTVSVPDDVDVEMVVGAAEGEQQPEVVVATDGSLNAEVYNADFADVGGMKQLIGQWMGGIMGGNDRESEAVTTDDPSVVAGLSNFLAEILAKLESAYNGAPLNVEISYEMEDDERLRKGESEFDIEIDTQLVPRLTPQFLDERLKALSDSLTRPLRPSPVRVSEVDLLDLAQEAAQESPSLGNCFNSGLCAWLCKHRRVLQYALGVETVLLVALFALYARIGRQAAQQGLDNDEESLRVPLIENAADYAETESGKASPLWVLTTKVALDRQ